MGANLMCLTMGGGIPLFSKTKGTVEPMGFSGIASLYGVHTFGKSQGAKFLNTKTRCDTVVWKEFNEAVILIAVGYLNDEAVLNYLLEAVFSSMVLFLGLDEIKNIKSIERTKRELRAAYPLIDKLMDCLDVNDKSMFVDMLYYTESFNTTHYPTLKAHMESYAESCGSVYGCVTVDLSVVAATDAWYRLSPVEKKLITYLVSTNNSCTSFDIPVFLPQQNPSECVRVVCVRLNERMCCTVLCGAEPDLLSTMESAYQIWLPLLSTLQSLPSAFPPVGAHLHSSLQGLLLVDLSAECFVYNVFTAVNRNDGKSSARLLKTFYYQAAHTLVDTGGDCVETYWCSDYHKAHALRRQRHLICVLYAPSTPVPTVRSITRETLKLLTKESESS